MFETINSPMKSAMNRYFVLMMAICFTLWGPFIEAIWRKCRQAPNPAL